MIKWLIGLTEKQEYVVNLFMTILLSTGFIVSTSLNPFIIAFYRYSFIHKATPFNYLLSSVRLYHLLMIVSWTVIHINMVLKIMCTWYVLIMCRKPPSFQTRWQRQTKPEALPLDSSLRSPHQQLSCPSHPLLLHSSKHRLHNYHRLRPRHRPSFQTLFHS